MLLGDDDLAVLVEPAVGADVMRKLHGAATGARGTRGGIDLHVGRTTVMRANATLLLLRYWHDDLPYILTVRHEYAQAVILAHCRVPCTGFFVSFEWPRRGMSN